MNTLVTGNLTLMTRTLCEQLARENHIIFYGTLPQPLPQGIDARYYDTDKTASEISLANLFATYSFDCVLYMSASLCSVPDWSQENNEMHNLWQLCCNYQVTRSVYVTLDIARVDTQDINETYGYNALLRCDTDRLCSYYQKHMNLTVLHIPFLYDKEQPIYPLYQILQIAHASSRLYYKGTMQDAVTFLSVRDFATLMERVFDSSEGKSYSVNPTQANVLGTLNAALQIQKPNLQIAYHEPEVGITLPLMKTQPCTGAREDFGWFAKDDVLHDLPVSYSAYRENAIEKKTSLWEKVQAKVLEIGKSTVRCALAVTALFALVELLIFSTSNVAELNFTDLRLVFVMIVASIYGLNAGMYGGLLACIAMCISDLQYGADWRVLFYNMENWIPFVFYLMIGMCLGYIRDKNRSAIKNREDKLKVTENKYLFMKSIYEDLLVAKTELKRQVLGSHESFGKIFDITRKIDKSMPEEVLEQTLSVMSETLENNSIAIYIVGKDRQYGRLVMCSPQMRSTLAKSIHLADYAILMQEMQEDAVWSNQRALQNYPAYCANVYQDNLPAYLIFIYQATFEQMSTYYVNQIKVLCGLAKGALLRALEDTRRRETERCIPGTAIYRAAYFKQLIATKQELQKSSTADFLLCRLLTNEKSMQEISEKLAMYMRINDIAGIGKDGQIYIAFAQVDADCSAIIINRFAKRDLQLTVVNCEEAI